MEFLSTYWWAFGLGALGLAAIAAIWQFRAVAGAPKTMFNSIHRTDSDPFAAMQQSFSRTANRLIGPAVAGLLALGCAICGGIGLIVAAVEYFKAT